MDPAPARETTGSGRAVRPARAVSLAVLVALAALPAAADSGTPVVVLSGNVATFSQPVIGTRTVSLSPQAGIALALGEGAATGDCATRRLLALRQVPASDEAALPVLGEAPVLRDAQTWLTAGGRIAIHYTQNRASTDAIAGQDVNLNGLPDYVEAVAEGLSQALGVAERAGFSVSLSRAGRLDAYLTNLSGAASGATVPLSGEPGAAFMLIDSRLHGDEALLRAVAAHQAAHAVLMAYDAAEAAWWHEASATMIEIVSQNSAVRHIDSLEALLSAPERGLRLSPAPGGDPDGLLWAGYLVESSGGRVDLLRRIWDDLAAVPGDNLLEATELALRSRGRTLEQTFAEFTTWNLFTGDRSDGLHYSFAELLGEPRFGSTHRIYPALSMPPTRMISPLGWSLIRFEAEGSTGGLFLTFEGDAPGEWEADLLIPSRDDPRKLHRASLLIDGSGRGSIGIPWNGAGEVLLLVRNHRAFGAPAGFSYAARSAPAFPYEVGALSAEPDADHVRVVWETESEDGLFGWEVFRSEGRGAFVRVTDVTIPSLGGPDDSVTYQFVDTSVRPGALYRYYVLGITTDGLQQRSFVVSTRLPR